MLCAYLVTSIRQSLEVPGGKSGRKRPLLPLNVNLIKHFQREHAGEQQQSLDKVGMYLAADFETLR